MTRQHKILDFDMFNNERYKVRYHKNKKKVKSIK